MDKTDRGQTAPAKLQRALSRLMDENAHNLEDPSDAYARGYHDAVLDVMDAMGIAHDEKHFD